jgi:L-ascorbate metabolism protein UlaG (beta-lactamase superfamily)
MRNATARLDYAGRTFLLDPMLSPKGALPSFAGIAPNPTVELPLPVGDILAGIDGVIVGHMHPDHFDAAAGAALPKSIPILTPDNAAAADPARPAETTSSFAAQLAAYGFTNVATIGDEGTTFLGVTAYQEFGAHGTGLAGELLGGINGIVLKAEGHPTIYWTGDTILDAEGRIEAILAEHRPDIVIAHTGGALVKALSPDPILMDEQQALTLFRAAMRYNPRVRIVAVHMNALDHCFTTRETLGKAIATLPADLRARIVLPREGERIAF